MSNVYLPAFSDDATPAVGAAGQIAHPAGFEHCARLERKRYRVGNHAGRLVGEGLANQSFIEGRDGLIVIDTGVCIEEMQDALRAIRAVTQTPVGAYHPPRLCIYRPEHRRNTHAPAEER